MTWSPRWSWRPTASEVVVVVARRARGKVRQRLVWREADVGASGWHGGSVCDR
jgi:hypothetical protein